MNYPRNSYELTLNFLQITLAIPTITFWNTIASISNYPCHLIYFPDVIAGLHVQEFLKIYTHTSDGIIAVHASYYG